MAHPFVDSSIPPFTMSSRSIFDTVYVDDIDIDSQTVTGDTDVDSGAIKDKDTTKKGKPAY